MVEMGKTNMVSQEINVPQRSQNTIFKFIHGIVFDTYTRNIRIWRLWTASTTVEDKDDNLIHISYINIYS
jgi:hypothetical protein